MLGGSIKSAKDVFGSPSQEPRKRKKTPTKFRPISGTQRPMSPLTSLLYFPRCFVRSVSPSFSVNAQQSIAHLCTTADGLCCVFTPHKKASPPRGQSVGNLNPRLLLESREHCNTCSISCSQGDSPYLLKKKPDSVDDMTCTAAGPPTGKKK